MIEFKKIIIEGFGSIVEETTFELDRPGINIIRGKIGSGKTTILSSLYWTLFGLKLKDKSSINTWEAQQPKNYQGTQVTLHFKKDSNDYYIIRCENFQGKVNGRKGGNSIKLFKGEDEVNLGKGKRVQQEALELFLGFSSQLFINAVIFGQKQKRIIEESGPKKKEIFEEAFSLLYISEALEITKKKLSNESELIQDLENQLDSKKLKLKSDKRLLKTQLQLEKNFNDNKQENLDRISKQMIRLKEEQAKLKPKVEDVIIHPIKELRIEKSELEKKISNNEMELNSTEKEISINNKNLKSLKKDKCFECGSVLNEKQLKKKKKKIKKELSALTYTLSRLKKFKPKKILKEISKIEKDIENSLNLKSNMEDYAEIKADIYDCNQEFKNEKAKELEIKSIDIKSSIKILRKEVRILKKDLKKAYKSHEITRWLVKEPLSNNGIKTYLLENLIQSVNDVLLEYSDTLQFIITFEIDMESSNKDFRQYIQLEDGQLVDYYDLSGGQRQLVDTSVALAINEVIGNMKPTNLLFMDEPFESLDKDTVDIISELINTKPRELSIFIITHQESFNPLNSNVINVKRNSKKRTIIL